MSQFKVMEFNNNEPLTLRLGQYLPPFKLRFYDDGGNESCAFRPPARARRRGRPSLQASPHLLLADMDDEYEDDDAQYAVRITCRDDNMGVGFRSNVPEWTMAVVRFMNYHHYI